MTLNSEQAQSRERRVKPTGLLERERLREEWSCQMGIKISARSVSEIC